MTINDFRVLMLDTDESLVAALSTRLRQSGFHVDYSGIDKEDYTIAASNSYDALVLNTNVDDNNADTVCENLRAHGVLTPIVCLSDKHDEYSAIHWLESGADEYLIKPVSHYELVARIKALVRRNNKSFGSLWISRNDLELDLNTNITKMGSQAVALTRKEAGLLHRLMEDTAVILSRETILKDVWGIRQDHTSNRLDVYIRRLRDKLKLIDADHLVHTLRGSGYYFGQPMVCLESKHFQATMNK